MIFLPAVIGAVAVTAMSFRIGLAVLAVQAAVFTYEMLPPQQKDVGGMPPIGSASHVAIALALLGVAAAVAAIALGRRWDQRQIDVGTTSTQSASALPSDCTGRA